MAQEAARDVVAAYSYTKKKRQQETIALDQKITQEDREMVRAELADLGRRLMEKHGLTIPQIRRFLHQILEVTV